MSNEAARTEQSITTATTHEPRRAHRLRYWALVIPLVAAAACGGGSDDKTPEPTPTSVAETTTSSVERTPQTAQSTATTGSRPTVTEPAPASIANGTHSVYLAGVDPGRRTISVDVVQVINPTSSEAATVCPEIARGDHDGYCIKNVNGQLRTMAVATKASLQVINGSSLRRVDMSGLAAARDGQKEDNFFQITVSGGRVTSVKELYRA